MTDQIFKATHRGYLHIADKKIPCAVLENGKRVISQTGLFDAFDRPRKGSTRVEGVPSIVGAKNLQDYIDDELLEKSKTIQYFHTNGRIAKGYDAELIPIVCDLYIEAKENNTLLVSQEHLYARAVTLIRSLAKVGITALIDEATGYQEDRDTRELQRLLEAYISADLMKWQRRFPSVYYKEIFRLYGWTYNPETQHRPSVIGKFTNKYIYDLFPQHVMDEIKRRNPKLKNDSKSFRRNKHHQYLTTDIGVPQLDNHISKILGVMKLSKDIKSFEDNFNIAFEDELIAKEEYESRMEISATKE
ncbi:P63C domain-containing protein [Paenibacillus lentus]|uniref:P63C domain-containing protein n=1 Tax=Paenibacillus lentus TaxID=1338368 RepID=UPI00365E672B